MFMLFQSMDKVKQQSTAGLGLNYLLLKQNRVYAKAKFISILSYLTLLGWLIATVLHGSQKSSYTIFHLKQSLGLIITGAILALIPLIGWLLNIAILFAWFYALFHVIQGHKQKVPFLGDFYQQHLDFIK